MNILPAASRYRKSKKSNKKKYIIFSLIAFAVLAIIIFKLISANLLYLNKTIYPLGYKEIVMQESEKYNVKPALVFAVIKAESNFNQNSESHAGAIGLMQLMPSTFEWLQTKIGDDNNKMTSEKLKDPNTNIEYGTYFLSYLIKKYNNEDAAICAYNAGQGKVDEWLSEKKYSSDSVHLDSIPYPETDNYLKSVKYAEEKYISLYFSK
ncbi:MAG: lytic transglycosylase domain-containing protein [Bacillota bacterium]|nr:lytic transglycosylase domain-containing protein [Bacillota bacterium]